MGIGMIFYFSGTGNSRGIAEILARRLGDRAVDIIGGDPAQFTFGEEDYLGFVFPVYAYAAPEVMLRFAAGIRPGRAYTFAVCTFSNVTGEALQHFSTVVPLSSGYGVKMPDNYPVLEKILDTKESSMEKLREARGRLEYVIGRIREKRREFDALMGEDAHHRTYDLAPQFNEKMRPTRPFWVEREKCIHCGLCEGMCPAEAIRVKDGFPVWTKESCFACMACLNRCPAEAIQFGEYSRGKFRYSFKGFDPENY